MAGHSRWKNIKHRKAAADAKRGKAWSKCAKAIMVAAKNGGPDPSTNLSLRYAIDEARYENVPRDTIERAIKKGTGDIDGANWESLRYEGYGPAGVAVIADALTNNRNRTATDLRLIFSKYGGNLGTTNCVAFQFDTKGIIHLTHPSNSPDQIIEAAIDAGAEDADEPESPGDPWTLTTPPSSLHVVRDALEPLGFNIQDARVELVPNTLVTITGDKAKSLLKLLDALEDNDDVQKVFVNADIPDADLDAAG